MDAPLRWRLAGCTIAFSTAADGDLREPPRRAAWLAAQGCPHPCAVPAVQVHGTAIADLDAGDAPAEGDGLLTADPGRAIGVFGADCPGLLLIAPDALAAAHCGWRGAAAGMAGRLAAALARRSAHPPARWRAFVGPGIAPARYEVDAPVLGARAWPAGSLRPGRDAAHAHLDLAAALLADCRAAGVVNAAACGVCTAGDPRLHSFRRHGRRLVQLLAVWRG